MAKVTISFVTDTDESAVKIESDTERNSGTNGKVKTKFRYGDTAFFRVYAPEPEKLSAAATDGTISDLGIFSDNHTESVLFASEDTAELERPAKKLTAYSWLGNSLDEISLRDPFTIRCGNNPKTDGPAMSLVTYSSVYRLYGLTLSGRDFDEYPVAVYVSTDYE